MSSERLDEAFLKKAFPHFAISIFDSLSSTSDHLKQSLLSPHLCIAEQQTAGRGRLGKIWFSPPGVNLYFSLLWPMQKTSAQLEGLSLTIALSIVRTLHSLGVTRDLKVKWPNDIYWQQKKLAGILVEINSELAEKNHVVLGIGLNVNMLPEHRPDATNPWTSLQQILNHPVNRNTLLVALLNQLIPDLIRFDTEGFIAFLPYWPSWDYLYHQAIQVEIANHIVQGKACGVNNKGHLLLQTVDDKLHAYSSGEISLL